MELLAGSPEAISVWVAEHEKLEQVFALFMTVTGGSALPMTTRFLLLAQALEVFHRVTTQATIMAPQQHRELSFLMLAAVPPGTSAAIRERLTRLLSYANEPSLQQRLKSTIKALAADFGRKPPAYDKAFINAIVTTRNYHTHLDGALEDRALSGTSMYWSERRMVVLLTVLFLRRLGVTAGAIDAALDRNREFSHLWKATGSPR